MTQQQTTERVAAALAASGLEAKAYHAGQTTEQRTATQDEFMASVAGIVVATIAFGMGIDKTDIRHVVHYNLPKSLEGSTRRRLAAQALMVSRRGVTSSSVSTTFLSSRRLRGATSRAFNRSTPRSTTFSTSAACRCRLEPSGRCRTRAWPRCTTCHKTRCGCSSPSLTSTAGTARPSHPSTARTKFSLETVSRCLQCRQCCARLRRLLELATRSRSTAFARDRGRKSTSPRRCARHPTISRLWWPPLRRSRALASGR